MDLYEAADTRARDLLCRVLPERQWVRFIETGILEVSGSPGIYRISPYGQTSVVDSQTRRPLACACLQLTVPAPVHDRIIAECMLIRNDENLYWRTANIFPMRMDERVFVLFLAALLDLTLLATFVLQLAT
jgi:hypothetical protein